MRIVSGTHKGRKLFTPPEDGKIRPTTDRVKEAIFDIIQFDIEGRKVLDLFAGCGQLGIEALSRGAASVTFVDESIEAIKLIKKNIEHCGFSAPEYRFSVVQADAFTFLKGKMKYDIILLDPPYKTNLVKKALKSIFVIDILENGGIIVCESYENQEEYSGFQRRTYKYGKTYVTVYSKELTD
ncbi:MAG: 16S rRNA (guanine(966)-N(2))-methyltransferase RsmD [Oscillospiraceae bacterium]|jgi:16S rRNA (guanine(966)-N(2))-methyltransferase RsmD|nr:16S rRNA (guanine(966)-N(2))-methyltransferase RsmD [Oscillospiraceae bacterium]